MYKILGIACVPDLGGVENPKSIYSAVRPETANGQDAMYLVSMHFRRHLVCMMRNLFCLSNLQSTPLYRKMHNERAMSWLRDPCVRRYRSRLQVLGLLTSVQLDRIFPGDFFEWCWNPFTMFFG